MIRITSKKEGFRRAGVAHSRTPKEYPDEAFTAEQLKQLKAEPMLVVELIDPKLSMDGKKKGNK
ncbi:hypothetical protein LJC47_00255 [Desulfosarcina sp. OttesenSCG-928-B08]|nr:hypothetical protein [Desulfosarcina sp. OttesenSCG-928-B08]